MLQLPGHLTAHADPLPCTMHFIHDVLEKSEEGWLPHVRKSSHPGIAPVYGQEILVQIVGADAEEIHFVRELVEDESRGRNFDHSPHKHRRVKCDLPGEQVSLDLRDLFLEPAEDRKSVV